MCRGFDCFTSVADLSIPILREWSGINREDHEDFYSSDTYQISAMVGDHSRDMNTQEVKDVFKFVPSV